MDLRRLRFRRRTRGVARFPLGQPGDPLLIMLPPHLEAIPVQSVVGSVDRHEQLDPKFRPLLGDTARLTAIRTAMKAGAQFPPIEVYRLEGACYVIDGHHRVAAALQVGQLYLDALVTECRLQNGEAENPLEEARVDFALRTGLRALTFSTPARYAQALAQIHEHRWYLGERGPMVILQAAADDWYETIYLPVLHLATAVRPVPMQAPAEAGDLYLRLSDLKYGVSRERGHDIGFAQAVHLWAARHTPSMATALLNPLLEQSII